MTTALGEKAIVDTLLATQIGEDKARVDTIYVNNIIPTPVSAPETLQATMATGNETTINMKIASTIDMYNIADTGFNTNIVKLSCRRRKLCPPSARCVHCALCASFGETLA